MSSSSGIQSLDKIYEFNEHFKKKETSVYEGKIQFLVNACLTAEQQLGRLGAKRAQKDVDALELGKRNVAAFIDLQKEKAKITATKIKELDLLKGKLKISNAALAPAKASTAATAPKAHEEKKEEESDALKSIKDIFHSTLHITLRPQSLLRQRDGIAKNIDTFLGKFEKLEIKKGDKKSWTAPLKAIFGMHDQTEFGSKNSGSLARGVYANLYNQLQEYSKLLVRSDQSDTAALHLQHIANLLLQTKYLEASVSSKPGQAERAAMLMKLHEFVRKAALYLDSTNKATAETKKMISDLFQIVNLTPKELETISKDEIQSRWDRVFTAISKSHWADEWTAPIHDGDVVINPVDALAKEFIASLEKLDVKKRGV